MKLKCRRSALIEALEVPGQIACQRTPKPALARVKLVAADNRLTVTATDLETTVTTTDLSVEVEEDGAVMVPAERLVALVAATTDDELTLETTRGRDLRVTTSDGRFDIPAHDERDRFPDAKPLGDDYDFSLPGGTLKRLINQTVFAAASENTRYVFNGALVVAKGKKVSMVGTDGRRLAQAKGDLISDKLPKEGATAIVPSKALNLLDKLIDDAEEAISVKFRDNQIIFRTASATLTSNLVEGQFPPYDDVIPKDTDKKMTANVAEFLNAIERAAIFPDDPSQQGVRFFFSKTGLSITAGKLREYGAAAIDFPCQYEGRDIVIGFNPHFVADALRVCGADTDYYGPAGISFA